MMYSVNIYIYCDWFTTSSPNAKDPHPIANGRRPHLFTTQLLLTFESKLPSCKRNAGHGNDYGSRGLHLPQSTLCCPQQSRLRKDEHGFT